VSRLLGYPVPVGRTTFPFDPRSPWLAFGLCGLAACGGAPDRPDVVLIVVDTLRADRLSTYGYPRPTAPFLDRLATEGALFLDATAQSSWTLPSMVSMFTGRYLTDYRDFIGPEAPTLPESFARAGYRTVGAAANILLTKDAGFGRGFDHFDPRPRAQRKADGGYASRTIETLLRDVQPALGAAFERDADGKRPPVFFYLHPFDPHDPYDDYPALHGVLPPEEILAVAPLVWQRDRFGLQGKAAPPTDPDWFTEWRYLDANRAYYDLGIRFTDDALGRAFEEWRTAGWLDDAVVVFASDHGEGLWEHVDLKRAEELANAPPRDFFYQKHGAHLYQEAVHTPLVMWGKGVQPGARIADPVENVDIFPTLLELASLAVPGPLHGQSLVPAMSGRKAKHNAGRTAVHSFVLHGTALREMSTNLKLIEPTQLTRDRFGRGDELYDLDDDPFERVDIASQQPADVARLRTALGTWRAEFPTASTFGRSADPNRSRMLKDLGYTGDHTGEDWESPPPSTDPGAALKAEPLQE